MRTQQEILYNFHKLHMIVVLNDTLFNQDALLSSSIPKIDLNSQFSNLARTIWNILVSIHLNSICSFFYRFNLAAALGVTKSTLIMSSNRFSE